MSTVEEKKPKREPEAERKRAPVIVHPFDAVRAVVRFVLMLAWTLLFCALIKSAKLLVLVSKPLESRVRKALGTCWIVNMHRIIGTRIVVHGSLPQSPFFIVGNHVAWLDLFAGAAMYGNYLNVSAIVEEPMRKMPIMGTLLSAFDPIYIRRAKDDTARVIGCMIEAIHNGKDIILAPENPFASTRPGKVLRQFRAGLLESAIQTGTPVYYASLTYRTPKGYPPPSESIVFGPSPFYRTADGKVLESELQAHGEERSFLGHLIGVLGMPWQECTFRIAPEPITAPDRVTLANKLHDAVEKIFVPLE